MKSTKPVRFNTTRVFFKKKYLLVKKRVYSTSDITNIDEAIFVLINHLKHLIKDYEVHYELSSRLKVFNKLSRQKKRAQIPGIYLEIEDFILLQKNNSLKSKEEIRDAVNSDYPILKKVVEFGLILLDENTQKVILSKLFLKDILQNSKNILGQFHNKFLIEADQKLSEDIVLTNVNAHESSKELKELVDYSNILQNKIEESLGKNAMLSIYNNAYNKLFNNYYLLDSFTITINLVPEELLITEDVNLPSKGQLHKLLKTQISSLEEINTKLSKEVLERVEVQKELQKNERLYSTILHNSLDANIIFNIEGEILEWNKKAKKLFNFSQGQANLFNVLPKELSENFKEKLHNASKKNIDSISEDVFSFELNDQKNTRYYNLKASPFYIEENIFFFVIINDVTKDKTSLKIVEDARNIAEKSAKVKTTFLSNMSHEIRTPLNVIKGLSELFTKEKFQGTAQEYENIEAIKFSADNLLMIVNDILDFSKIEAGKLSIQEVDFNFPELIDNLKHGFNLKATEKGLKFNVELDNNIPKYIVGDQFRLSQILNNLLGNALKFTKEGSVGFSIKTKKRNENTITLGFTISDTGQGISKKQEQHIFNSFYQTINEQGQKPEGTGLGLSITKQLVELLGGQINVESTIGKGTVFTFDIIYPISKLSDDTQAEIIKNRANHLLKDKQILVVEDNKLNQLFIKQLLTKWNAIVAVAENGQEALNKLEKQTFDLILMDIQMPVMDGITATKKIRALKDETKNNIPIVACSADVFPESRKKAEDVGMNFYITKPINLDSINEILFLLTQ